MIDESYIQKAKLFPVLRLFALGEKTLRKTQNDMWVLAQLITPLFYQKNHYYYELQEKTEWEDWSHSHVCMANMKLQLAAN